MSNISFALDGQHPLHETAFCVILIYWKTNHITGILICYLCSEIIKKSINQKYFVH